MELTHITNWLRVDENITTSGQPNAKQFEEIAAMGVSHILNLGLINSPKALDNEVGVVLGLGMDYVHIPVQFDGPTDEDFEEFSLALDNLIGKKIHIHCIMNYRVTAFLTRYFKKFGYETFIVAQKNMLSIWTPDEIWQKFIDG